MEYLTDTVSLRTEYAFSIKDNVHGAYVELAYRFVEKVQAAVRYDFALIQEDEPGPDSQTKHSDAGVALSYSVSPSLSCAPRITL